MNRKTQTTSLLALPPVTGSPINPSSGGNLTSLRQSRALVRTEQRILGEAHKQQLIIDLSTAKTVYGQAKLAQMQTHTVDTAVETADAILAHKHQARTDAELQQVADEICAWMVQKSALHLTKAYDAGATAVLHEIERSLYFEMLPEQSGFLAWLRGE